MADDIIARYKNIKKKNFLIELLPWVGGGTSTAIYPNVFLSRRTYESVHSSKPDQYKVSTLIHEEEHIKRIEQLGPKKWYWLYISNGRFRIDEELAADMPQFSYLKKHGLSVDLERKAKALSGHLYLWAISKDQALKRLTEIWDKA